MTLVTRLAVVLLALLVASCGDTVINNLPNDPTPPPTTPVVKTVQVQFRVTGNANGARIRYSTPSDGLVQTTSTLPFFTSFNTSADNLFLSLEVTPTGYSTLVNYPFLSAQILVNNDLFREATSNEFLLYTISVNGVWRK